MIAPNTMKAQERPAVLLTELAAGQWFLVRDVSPQSRPVGTRGELGGWGAMRRLADLGLLPGVRARVVRRSRGGPVLIEVKGSRLAVGHALAARIAVELVEHIAPEARGGRDHGAAVAAPVEETERHMPASRQSA